MKRKMAPPKRNPVPTEDAHVTALFADEVVGLAWHSGVARLTFSAWRFGLAPNSAPERKVVGRIEMPIAGIEALMVLLIDTLAKMKTQQAAGEGAGSETVQ